MVSPERGSWHCFGCNEGGDIFSFLMKYESLEFYEALKVLAEKAGIELQKASPSDYREFGVLYDINSVSAEFFREQLASSSVASEYLKNRGLPEDIISEFGIGFAPEEWDSLTLYLSNKGFDVKDMERAGMVIKTTHGNYVDRFRGRIMFPLSNIFGKVVGFSGRILPEFDDGKSGKYINSPETPIFRKSRVIYGLHEARDEIRNSKAVLLVEGQMDVIMCHKDGVKNAVGTSGTALTEEHLSLLKRYASKIIMDFDNDEAGRNAAERSMDMAYARDFEVMMLDHSVFPEVAELKDAADVVKAHPGVMSKLVASAIPGMEYYFRHHSVMDTKDLSSQRNNSQFIMKKIMAIPSAAEKAYWLRELALRSGIRENDILSEFREVAAARVPDRRSSAQDLSAPSRIPLVRPPKVPRIASIVDRINMICLNWPDMKEKFSEASEYFPADRKETYDLIGSGDKEKVAERMAELSMKAAFEVGNISEEDAEKEMLELVRNLELEYFIGKRDELSEKLRKLSPEDTDLPAVAAEVREISERIGKIRNKK